MKYIATILLIGVIAGLALVGWNHRHPGKAQDDFWYVPEERPSAPLDYYIPELREAPPPGDVRVKIAPEQMLRPLPGRGDDLLPLEIGNEVTPHAGGVDRSAGVGDRDAGHGEADRPEEAFESLPGDHQTEWSLKDQRD